MVDSLRVSREPCDFYVQTRGNEPEDVVEFLDEILGPGKYGLKMVDIDRWILTPQSDVCDKIKRGSNPGRDYANNFLPLNRQSSLEEGFYITDIPGIGPTDMSRPRSAHSNFALLTGIMNLWEKVRRGR